MASVKNWASILDENTRLQAEMLSRSDVVCGHVALMPDAHLGKGATVGSVIPTKGGILPAAVGVDIGCFTGETLIPLLDGKDHSIKELVGREVYVYAALPEGKITVTKATAKLTQRAVALIAVTLDNGEIIRCTPAQQFMLRDGTYIAADQLTLGQSLMPLYLCKDINGYMLVQQPAGGGWQAVHWVVGRSGLLGSIPHPKTKLSGDKILIHHKSFIEPDGQANNLPENLQFMTFIEHSTLHREVRGGWPNDDFEFQEKRHAGIAHRKADPSQQRLMAEVGARNWRTYNATPEFREMVAEAGQRGREYLIQYNQSDHGRQISSNVAHREYTCPHCGKTGKSGFFYKHHMDNCHQGLVNHKVMAVTPLVEREDVYCLTVPDYANFALSAGVFVHNCGMCAVKTTLTKSALPADLKPLHEEISRSVKSGWGKNSSWSEPREFAQKWLSANPPSRGVIQNKLEKTALNQLGTLGSGNHFIEVCLDIYDVVWVVLHSGSRGVGNRLAVGHIKCAVAQCADRGIKLEDPDLAYLTQGTDEFNAYIEDMNWCQRYALANREGMMDAVLAQLFRFADGGEEVDRINCHHNFTQEETHFGQQVWLTRKGAIYAGVGARGIVPGSMATATYITEGLGNPASYNSSAHGAGRKMSRGQAKRELPLDGDNGLRSMMADTAWNEKDAEALLDEHPLAYKDINKVMVDQADLCRPINQLRQILNFKGA